MIKRYGRKLPSYKKAKQMNPFEQYYIHDAVKEIVRDEIGRLVKNQVKQEVQRVFSAILEAYRPRNNFATEVIYHALNSRLSLVQEPISASKPLSGKPLSLRQEADGMLYHLHASVKEAVRHEVILFLKNQVRAQVILFLKNQVTEEVQKMVEAILEEYHLENNLPIKMLYHALKSRLSLLQEPVSTGKLSDFYQEADKALIHLHTSIQAVVRREVGLFVKNRVRHEVRKMISMTLGEYHLKNNSVAKVLYDSVILSLPMAQVPIRSSKQPNFYQIIETFLHLDASIKEAVRDDISSFSKNHAGHDIQKMISTILKENFITKAFQQVLRFNPSLVEEPICSSKQPNFYQIANKLFHFFMSIFLMVII